MTMSARIDNYTLLYQLGAGTYSKVYMAVHDKIGNAVAIKHIVKRNFDGLKQASLSREIDIMKMALHQHVVELFEVIEDAENCYLVMELLSQGPLSNMFGEGKIVPEQECQRLFKQILLAVGYIHEELRVMHRDLKLENILLDSDGNVRISDFGLSVVLQPGASQTACGSPAYAAPEVLTRSGYGQSADLWSLGVMLFVMATGRLPFGALSLPKLVNQILYEHPVIPDTLSYALQDLLKKLLQKRPEHRIGLHGILAHPWMAEAMKDEPQNCGLFKSRIRNDAIDLSVVVELEKLGVDRLLLREGLQKREYDDVTGMYRIKRRDRAIAEANAALRVLSENAVCRHGSCPLDTGKMIIRNRLMVNRLPKSGNVRPNHIGSPIRHGLLPRQRPR